MGAIQDWLERVLGTPRPSSVDSAAIAGVMDILRTQGIWSYSVRYSFLFSCRRGRHASPWRAVVARCFKERPFKILSVFSQAGSFFFAEKWGHLSLLPPSTFGRVSPAAWHLKNWF